LDVVDRDAPTLVTSEYPESPPISCAGVCGCERMRRSADTASTRARRPTNAVPRLPWTTSPSSVTIGRSPRVGAPAGVHRQPPYPRHRMRVARLHRFAIPIRSRRSTA